MQPAECGSSVEITNVSCKLIKSTTRLVKILMQGKKNVIEERVCLPCNHLTKKKRDKHKHSSCCINIWNVCKSRCDQQKHPYACASECAVVVLMLQWMRDARAYAMCRAFNQ